MARKRKAGEGGVHLRKDGRWEGRIVIGYDENGYPHVCLDEAMKRRLEIKLIHAIVTTK